MPQMIQPLHDEILVLIYRRRRIYIYIYIDIYIYMSSYEIYLDNIMNSPLRPRAAAPRGLSKPTYQCEHSMHFSRGPNKSMSHDITTFSTCSRIMAFARCTSAASPNCTCSQVFQPPKHRKKRPTCSSVPLIRNLSQEPLIF